MRSKEIRWLSLRSSWPSIGMSRFQRCPPSQVSPPSSRSELPSYSSSPPLTSRVSLSVPSPHLGGAIGMVTYDCIHHFEPRTARPLRSPFEIPESVFMFQDTLVIFDHLYQTLKLVSHVFLPDSPSPDTPSSASSIPSLYSAAVSRVQALARSLLSPTTPLPPQPPILQNQTFTSNVGKEGYESFVTQLKQHIVKGDIIQAVPSQRLTRPTSLHPFNAYRQLRSLNPSPYMFYIDFGDLQLVGASPETLCKVEKRKVYNHAIAGTVKRGKTPEGQSSLRTVFYRLLAYERQR